MRALRRRRPMNRRRRPRQPTRRRVRQSQGADSRRVELLRTCACGPAGVSATVLRGLADEATRRFQEGMKAYSTRDFRGAVPILREAAALDPTRPDIAFLRGTCRTAFG